MMRYTQTWIPGLARFVSPKLSWAWTAADRLMGVYSAHALIRDLDGLRGQEFVNRLLNAAVISSDMQSSTTQNIPGQGALVVVANHHLGAVDGLLALSALLRQRPDVKVVANESLVALCPQIAELLIPVHPLSAHRNNVVGTRKIAEHLRTGGALLIFPAGRIASKRIAGAAVDDVWSETIAHLVHRFQASVVPLAFGAQNSPIFYLARRIHPRFGTFLLLREALRKRGQTIPVYMGYPLSYSSLRNLRELEDLLDFLRSATYSLLPSTDDSTAVAQSSSLCLMAKKTPGTSQI